MPRARLPVPACRGCGVDFASMLGDLAAKTAGDVRNAETLSIAGVRGQASVQQVVEAVMSAEQSLQTAIAVRDKVVSAYLEISRMSI
jgi:flagellar hook-basal body complex protein FliE